MTPPAAVDATAAAGPWARAPHRIGKLPATVECEQGSDPALALVPCGLSDRIGVRTMWRKDAVMTDSNTATIPAIVRERAARGLAWIIEHGSAHGVDLDRVDLDMLDLGGADLCVLGQGHGGDDTGSGYSAVLASVFGPEWDWDHADEADQWTVDHGFVVDYSTHDVTVVSLTEAWRQAITVHRAGQ